MNYYIVQAVYPAQYWPTLDDRIRKRIGHSDASGMGFGERDQIWYRKTRRGAMNLAKCLRNMQFQGKRRITVTVTSNQGD